MATEEELKQRICESVDRRRSQIEGIGDTIMANPELGFKEFETAKLVASTFEEFGFSPETGLARTGVKAVLKGKKPGPTVALIGELDSLGVSDHPMVNPETGAAHACGHNAQIAGLLGAMMAMVDTQAAEELAGNIVFFAVPAEEYVEIEFRRQLVTDGELSFLGGKCELIKNGHFDDIDVAMMIHTNSDPAMAKTGIAASMNGFISKLIRFVGKAAHAGGGPHLGVNALNAAMIAMSAIHAQRETFRDDDSVRIHPIITKGGDIVNVVPADVRMETFIRGKTKNAILDANAKVDRALRAGALAVGATVEIETLPGYLPLANDPALTDVFETNSKNLFDNETFTRMGHRASSTDLGDVSHLLPSIHPYMNGGSGSHHSKDWHISDKEMGYLGPAKSLATMAIDLLYGDAAKAKEVIENHKPLMTKQAYLAYQDEISGKEVYDGETGTSA